MRGIVGAVNDPYYHGVIYIDGCGWLWVESFVDDEFYYLCSFVFRNNDPSLASAANAVTSLRMVQVMRAFPFHCMDFPSTGMLPRKNYSPAQLQPLPADKYDASK